MYEYDNKKFSSIKKLAEYVGINEKTLTARLRRNIPLEKACQPKLYGRVYVDEGQSESISDLAKKRKLDPRLVYNRRRYGFSNEEAFNMPKKITRQGMPIVVNGIMYPSISMAARELHVESKLCTIRRRLREGVAPDVAFRFE